MTYDLKSFGSAVINALTVLLNQNQFDVLVSLIYNIGTGAFSESTLVKKLNTIVFSVLWISLKYG